MLILFGRSKCKMRSRFLCSIRQRLQDLLRDEFARILKRKVAGIEQVQLRLRNVAQVGLALLRR